MWYVTESLTGAFIQVARAPEKEEEREEKERERRGGRKEGREEGRIGRAERTEGGAGREDQRLVMETLRQLGQLCLLF